MIDEQTLLEQLLEGGIFGPEDGSPPQQVTVRLLGKFENQKERPRLPRSHRTALRLSQSKLARLAGVSRFKICTYELGGGCLTAEEQDRICQALRAEVNLLRSPPARIDLCFQEEVP